MKQQSALPITCRRSLQRALILSAWLAPLCLALAGCATGDERVEAPSGTVVATSAEQAAPTELGEVVWASDVDPDTSEPVGQRETFARDDDVIYAVVRTGPLAAGTTLTATWTFNGQSVEGIEVAVTADEARGAGWVEFHLEWNGATLWPVGTLAITITASTGESTEGAVEIRAI